MSITLHGLECNVMHYFEGNQHFIVDKQQRKHPRKQFKCKSREANLEYIATRAWNMYLRPETST